MEPFKDIHYICVDQFKKSMRERERERARHFHDFDTCCGQIMTWTIPQISEADMGQKIPKGSLKFFL